MPIPKVASHPLSRKPQSPCYLKRIKIHFFVITLGQSLCWMSISRSSPKSWLITKRKPCQGWSTLTRLALYRAGILSSNTRRLFNILFSPPSDSPEMVLSLDAQTVFDHVECRYLFFVLKKFGFSSSFINWIKLLYKCPMAFITTNGLKSDLFPLHT